MLQAIIAENDVVLGVFNDDEDPRGWSHVIIKGEHALSESVRTKTTVDLKTAAIPSQEADEALAMREVFAAGGPH